MPNRQKVQQIALAKIKWMGDQECGGYLTPSEVKEIVLLGVWQADKALGGYYLESKLKRGYCAPSWFYFQPGKYLREILLSERKTVTNRQQHDPRKVL
jgi:hypothetical protein